MFAGGAASALRTPDQADGAARTRPGLHRRGRARGIAPPQALDSSLLQQPWGLMAAESLVVEFVMIATTG